MPLYNPVGVPITAPSPTWTQGASITFTNSYAEYIQIGKLVHYFFKFIATSAGTATSPISVGIPVTSLRSGLYAGAGICHIYMAGATSYDLVPYLTSTSVVNFTSDTSGGNNFGTVPAVTVASGDYIDGVIEYIAA